MMILKVKIKDRTFEVGEIIKVKERDRIVPFVTEITAIWPLNSSANCYFFKYAGQALIDNCREKDVSKVTDREKFLYYINGPYNLWEAINESTT